ncbi:MAG: hypothetical protein ACT4QF_06035 [Sporichthyaceae bacterium]
MDVPRRSFAFVGVGMAIAMVAGPIAIASRGSDGDSRLVKFVATEIASATSDKAPKGVSPGDRFKLTQDLALDGGRRVGTANVDCVHLKVGSSAGRDGAAPRVNSVTLRCTGLLSLPDGRVEFTGRNTFAPGSPTSSRFDLIGGTGSYADVAGELIADEQGNGRTTLWLDRVIADGDRVQRM